ncbi:MAG: hypothetical protein GX772_04430 [Alcaligenaceae bacterium]|nr:hypothetical protein [Alcaligenaceae bacterium]
MTDKKTDMSKDERARSQSSVLTTPASKRVPPPDGATPQADKPKSGSRSVLAPAALVLALVAVGVSGALWQQHRQAQESQAELSARLSAQLAGSETAAGRSSAQIHNLLDRVQKQEARLETLQGQLGEASAIIRDLDEALRSMTDRGSELVLLNDVDHLVTIAQQQLQLGGNVRNAIVALESAQAQLARANRASLASLQQTLNGDLDRLRAAATIDIAAFSAQLEELAILLTEAPLIMPEKEGRKTADAPREPAREHPAPTVPPAAAEDGRWWEQAWDTTRTWSRDAWDSLRDDLGQFIEVRRVDDASALLMSPDQATRFRDNLRTRVMTAQLALMMRQPEIWQAETEAVVKAIEGRYDESSPMTRKALRMARHMADATIDAELPTVDNTLQALAALREEQTRGFGGAEPASSENTPPEAGSGANGTPDGQPEAGANGPADSAPEAQPETGPGQADEQLES